MMHMANSLRLVVIVLQALCVLQHVRADCPGWLPGSGVAGVNGTVYATAVWDPDGAEGPKGELLILAGSFTFAGDTAAANIVAWDGEKWHALGAGLTGGTSGPVVYALAEFGGNLVVGGSFAITTPTGNASNIAMWDGTNWKPVGNSLAGQIKALCVHRGELIAAGTFQGTPSTGRLAWLNGSTWEVFAGGIGGGYANALVSDGEKLYVGGKFTTAGTTAVNNIAAWDGERWDNMEFGLLFSSSFQTGVLAMTMTGPDLVVAGWFDFAGGNPVKNAAVWNGVYWEPMGDGIANPVYGLYASAGEVVAVGGSSIQRWNGWVWTALPWNAGANGSVRAVTVFADALHVAGGFITVEPAISTGVARLDGEKWTGLTNGLTRSPTVLAALGNYVYAGFGTADGLFMLAWDGQEWTYPFSSSPSYFSSVTALGVHQGELIAAGRLVTRSGAVPTRLAIARWRMNEWQPIGVLGGVTNGNVLVFATYNGDLIAGGDFSSIDQQSATRVARWDGTAWRAMGGTNGTVRCLGEYQGSLIVGGGFTQAGSVQARNIAAWTTSGFVALGNGLDNTVRAVATFDGSLYAGGAFLRSGTTQMRGLAKWNGELWSAVSSTTIPEVVGLVVNDGLVAIGTNPAPGSRGMARWSGSDWSVFGTGLLGGPLAAIVNWKSEIVVAGPFTGAGGQQSWGLARWSDSGAPVLTDVPESADIGCGESAEFSVRVASGYGEPEYRWERNGVAIDPGANPSAATKTLIVPAVSHADDGSYRCVVGNACGQTSSPDAILVSTCCPADLNHDWAVDDGDFQIFASAYNLLLCGDSQMPAACPADQNRDGLVDDADFQLFIGAYDALECP
ncbi:MAG: immunoglobulin domain-containing protein [Phycisphaerae bacterium]|nr:immunoglobulin domain-containing protein [Phycisphaerae bacterium]